ncbi:MAG: PadR family transcriptional regulator [Desulfosalsimonas sp.]|uniref:PadR family transcriptional regulator n=1 Tax=Desulfosalsimonas sp. TaxID=3073848 RepID=UPI003970F6AB
MDTYDLKAVQREILLGFWKIHILYHAAEGPVVGQWMLTELRCHGYEVSPGTLYPILHRMEKLGWLYSQADAAAGSKARRSFYATEKGRQVLEVVMGQLKELVGEAAPRSNISG